jgi:hypothetical protein
MADEGDNRGEGNVPPTAPTSSAQVVHATPPPRLLIDDVVGRELGGKATAHYEEPPRMLLGYWVFLWLLGLLAVFAGLLVVYAVCTFPRFSDIQAALANQSQADMLKAYTDARSAWVGQFKDIGQLYVISPIVPLLGAVLGYIFGHQTSKSTSGAAD